MRPTAVGHRGRVPVSGHRFVNILKKERRTRVRIAPYKNRIEGSRTFYWDDFGGPDKALEAALLWRDLFLSVEHQLNHETKTHSR